MNRLHRASLLFSLVAAMQQCSYAIFPITLTRSWDIYSWIPRYTHNYNTRFEVAMLAEFGTQAHAAEGEHRSPFQLWQCSNNTLAMIKGFSLDSCDPIEREIAAFEENFITINSDEDAVNAAQVKIHGNLVLDYNVILAARYHFPYDVTLGLYIPFLSFHTNNISIVSEPAVTAEDMFVHELLVNNLAAVVDQFGHGLQIAPWHEQGLGDISLIASWTPEFPQRKKILKNVRLHFDLGVSLPTAEQVNVNHLLPVPLGNNGSTGLFFGAGIDLRLGRYIRVGVDGGFLELFTHVGPVRVRTFGGQPDLLFLHKEQCVLKDWGFTQQYNLYAQLYKFLDCFSLRALYQFTLHDEDVIALDSDRFSSFIAKGATSLQGWTTHEFMFSIDYDANERAGLKPYIMWFYKLPFNGCRSILMHTTGLVFALRY